MASVQWFHCNEYSAHWQFFCVVYSCNASITLLFYGKVFLFRHIGFMAILFLAHRFHGNSIFSTSVSWQSYFRHTSKVTEHISVETDTRSLKGQCTRWTEEGICTATRERTPLAIRWTRCIETIEFPKWSLVHRFHFRHLDPWWSKNSNMT